MLCLFIFKGLRISIVPFWSYRLILTYLVMLVSLSVDSEAFRVSLPSVTQNSESLGSLVRTIRHAIYDLFTSWGYCHCVVKSRKIFRRYLFPINLVMARKDKRRMWPILDAANYWNTVPQIFSKRLGCNLHVYWIPQVLIKKPYEVFRTCRMCLALLASQSTTALSFSTKPCENNTGRDTLSDSFTVHSRGRSCIRPVLHIASTVVVLELIWIEQNAAGL